MAWFPSLQLAWEVAETYNIEIESKMPEMNSKIQGNVGQSNLLCTHTHTHTHRVHGSIHSEVGIPEILHASHTRNRRHGNPVPFNIFSC